jgi:hypothetical protein
MLKLRQRIELVLSAYKVYTIFLSKEGRKLRCPNIKRKTYIITQDLVQKYGSHIYP